MVEAVITNLEIPDHDGENSTTGCQGVLIFVHIFRGGAGAPGQSPTQLHHPLLRVVGHENLWLLST